MSRFDAIGPGVPDFRRPILRRHRSNPPQPPGRFHGRADSGTAPTSRRYRTLQRATAYGRRSRPLSLTDVSTPSSASGSPAHATKLSSSRTATRMLASSPGGRGTRNSRRAAGRNQRFIPARAGNTQVRSSMVLHLTVHPRAGGEHGIARAIVAAQFGSSPRGRGTPLHGLKPLYRERFIPARAGNTRTIPRMADLVSVHPRAGGEHIVDRPRCPLDAGSSPRGRGTRRLALP